MVKALHLRLSRCVKALAPFGVAALSLVSALTATVLPVTQAAAAPGISVFVGYADSVHALGDFPNPWYGSPGVTFDGCAPASHCTFDAGAIRIENDNGSSVMVNQISIDIAACAYTWNGSLYPVTLAPGASLVITQRASGAGAGCTGPDPSSFDSSDIPSSGVCINDEIRPTVAVTVDGIATNYIDSGQVLNTKGIDPGTCTNTNESTEWVRIGSTPCPGQSLSLAPPSQTHSVGATATVSATFNNACGSPLSGVPVRFDVIAGPDVGLTGSGITNAIGKASFAYSTLVPGLDTLQATVTNFVGFTRTSNMVTVTWTVEFAPGGGSFVIGNDDAVIGNVVNFWGAQWAKRNSLSGGPAPRSFKGFAESPITPRCGEGWTADPGNSTPPPDGPLPGFMAVVVTSAAHQSGSNIAGDTVKIVIVRTNPGYEPNPGHAATGTVVAVVCGASIEGASASPHLPSSKSDTVASGLVSSPTTAGRSSCPVGGSMGRPTSCGKASHDQPPSKRPDCIPRK